MNNTVNDTATSFWVANLTMLHAAAATYPAAFDWTAASITVLQMFPLDNETLWASVPFLQPGAYTFTVDVEVQQEQQPIELTITQLLMLQLYTDSDPTLLQAWAGVNTSDSASVHTAYNELLATVMPNIHALNASLSMQRQQLTVNMLDATQQATDELLGYEALFNSSQLPNNTLPLANVSSVPGPLSCGC